MLVDRHRLAAAWDGAGHTQEAMTQYWRLLSDCDRFLGPDDSLTRRLAADLVPPPRPWRSTEPLGMHRRWLVALAAILSARAHDATCDTLYPTACLNRHAAVAELKSDWGVSSRDDLLSTHEWLTASGHRASLAPGLGHSPVSWDFARCAFAVRNALAAEYIDEPEAWRLLDSIAGKVAGCYQSWREFADDYLAARAL